MPSQRIRARTLAELYGKAAEAFTNLPAFATRQRGNEFSSISFGELYGQGLNLATALISLGVEARDHVGLLSDNRQEWMLCDYGVILAGAADVPRGTDITESEITHILSHADVRVVFVENLTTFEKLRRCLPMLDRIQAVILMHPKQEAPAGVLKLENLVAEGAALRAKGDRRAEQRIADTKPDDLFTIIYTSGTTGTPKGVQLTHANMCSQIDALPFDISPEDRALSILPIWHSYERVFEMVVISMGACTYYTSLRAIGEDLKKVKPTVMSSAPRLWEALYQKILENIEAAPPLRRRLFQAAYASARTVKRAQRFFLGQQLDMTGRRLPASLSLAIGHAIGFLLCIVPYRILDPIVLKKLRQIVGGHFRGTISGGGALQPHVDEFFNFIGIPVLEGYGLTETAPVLAVRTWDNLVIGTVGPPYPGTKIRIVDLDNGQVLYPNPSRKGGGRGLRGEIHAAGPQIMKGYYKDPEGTARVLRDGWLNTGDIGMITFNDCLKILGRSKDTIVLLSGENVEPLPIECRLTHSPLIDHCMVVGQDQKALGLLAVPSLEGFRAQGIELSGPDEVEARRDAAELFDAEIRRLIGPENGFKPFERIAQWRIVSKPFEVGDEMTATYKLKRHVITAKYQGLLREMYPSPQGR